MTETDTPQPGEREELRPGDIEAARNLVDRICKTGERAWRMCIPPQPDDSDMLLTRVIDAAESATRELVEARAEAQAFRMIAEGWVQLFDGTTEPVPPVFWIQRLEHTRRALAGVPTVRVQYTGSAVTTPLASRGLPFATTREADHV